MNLNQHHNQMANNTFVSWNPQLPDRLMPANRSFCTDDVLWLFSFPIPKIRTSVAQWDGNHRYLNKQNGGVGNPKMVPKQDFKKLQSTIDHVNAFIEH